MGDPHGILASLSQRVVGDLADATASIGAVFVSVYDACDFDEDGGWLTINGTAYRYLSVDMETDTIALGTPLTAAVSIDDAVSLWDVDNAVIVTENTALVQVDGQDDGDPILAVIDHALTPLLAQGTFVAGQSVSLTRDGEEHRVTAVHGRTDTGTVISGAATLYSGTGTPTISANKGDLYIRTDTPGTANQRLYINTATGSSWSGIV